MRGSDGRPVRAEQGSGSPSDARQRALSPIKRRSVGGRRAWGWRLGHMLRSGTHAQHTHSPSFFFRRTEREWPTLPPSPRNTLLPPSSRHAALQDAQRHAGRPPQRLPGRLGPGPGSHRCCVAGGGRRLHAPPGKRKAFFFVLSIFGVRGRAHACARGSGAGRAPGPPCPPAWCTVESPCHTWVEAGLGSGRRHPPASHQNTRPNGGGGSGRPHR